jgi:hypothetical protein
MADRIGVCGDCKAKFKIPPTFQGTKAKCKKCGGVVKIPAAEAEAPKPAAESRKPAPAKRAAPAKKAAPQKKPAAAGAKAPAKPVRKSSMASRRAAGKGGARARGGRRKAQAEEGSDTKKWIFIGGGVSVVAIILLVILFSGGDEEPTVVETTNVAQNEDAPPVEETPVVEPEEEPAEDLQEEAPPPTEPENVVEVPTKEEEVNPLIEFEPIPPMAGCTQERFDELTEAYTNGYLKEDLPAYKRRKFKKTWDKAKEEGYEVIPVMLNAFNGLDLLTRDDVAMGFRIAQEWNEFSGKGYVDLNFKGDITDAEMHENLKNNVVTVTSLISLWQKKYAQDADQQEKFISRVEQARAMAAERASKDDDE